MLYLTAKQKIKMSRFIIGLISLTIVFYSCSPVSDLSATGKWKRKKIDEIVIPKTAEEKFISENILFEGCGQWQHGKRFIYDGETPNILLKPVDLNEVIPDSTFHHKIFTFHSFAEYTTFGGEKKVALIFECEGKKYQFNTDKVFDQISDTSYRPMIPNLISLDEIDKFSELLVGKQLYIRTPQWYNLSGERIDGKKLVPITVKEISVGNTTLPVKLTFTDSEGKEAMVLLSLKTRSETGENRIFDRMFSFENPRLRYPTISDDIWERITKGTLVKGMTKEECRLSRGMPEEVKQIPTYSGLREQWLYELNEYLYFEDGLLIDFRIL